ncbi:hypothetical protein GJ744_009966 [Endocarpon pusillum]|uniref:Heterokaryon incompatibility domain-containing protein n=1 Tax=Endocarpon pusillum TaxID=364733 RepID=A0A8H7AHF7_9EURO|nr:hypothetical protein GJ744_009966 [Endocarpon pusillum]
MDHLRLSIDEEFRPKYYKPNLFEPCHEFHSFPKAAGYFLSDEQELKHIEGGEVKEFHQFIQSWLFFGLLATVIQLPENESFFDGNFLSEDGWHINTEKLTDYLEKWQKQEVGRKDGQTIRMIRAQVALDLAREVVRNHCSVDGKFYVKNRIDEELSLSLMVLGETLTNAKSKIVEKVGFNIRGWHGDATEGWGNPACLLSKMEGDAGWCPRTLHILKGQLKSLATSMLSAYKSHDSAILRRQSHVNCDAMEPCQAKSVNADGIYVTKHHPRCPDPDPKGCPFIEPDSKEKILAEIEKDNFPLLRYQDDTKQLQVVPYEPHEKYATISHVWADGYGNPYDNKLWRCQLDYFHTLFKELPARPPGQEYVLFWIDTLAIPVGKSQREKELRKRAIRRIHDIYTKARYTVVIDNGLIQMKPSTYEGTAMKILASGWMRRLWTLQEAYLSKRLLFAFKDQHLKNLDELEEMYPKANDSLTSNIPTAARNYFHNMLGPDRSARINELSSASGYGLLASVWRAAQWRTTSHSEHETLALATLLNVEYDESISQAGLSLDAENANARSVELEKAKRGKSQLELDRMMRDLWKVINETCPGSIPSGIIFMPGKRICLEGYRWAPRTWMSGQEVDYPDPLSILTHPATLTGKGLSVIYPGFLLHTKTRSDVLGANDEDFHFAIDSTLLEWYSVNWKIEPIHNVPVGLSLEEKQLAIILCRPRPRELPEIALLVEIEKTIKQRSLIDQRQSNIYYVYIVCRIKIKREIKEALLSKWKEDITQSITRSNPGEGKVIFGEVLDENQRWYVDGRPDSMSLPDDIERPPEIPTDRNEKATPNTKRPSTRTRPIQQKGKTRASNTASTAAGLATRTSGPVNSHVSHDRNKPSNRFGPPPRAHTSL